MFFKATKKLFLKLFVVVVELKKCLLTQLGLCVLVL